MKKFLCYDTNDAASGKINVSANGMLKPNSTVPSTNSAPYQQLVTDGEGNVRWEDRLAYDDSKVVVGPLNDGTSLVKVADEIPGFVSAGEAVNIYLSIGEELHCEIRDLDFNPDVSSSVPYTADAWVVFIAENNQTTYLNDNLLTFPQKGVYFSFLEGTFYVSGFSRSTSDTPEITWDGNIGGIKKIDEKYLPDTIATKLDVKVAYTEAVAAQTAADKNKETLSQMLTYVLTFMFDKQTSGRDTFEFNSYNYYKISDFNPSPDDVISFTGTRESGANLSTITTGNNCVKYGFFIVVASAGICSLPITGTVTGSFTVPSAGLYARYEEGNTAMTAGTGKFTMRVTDGSLSGTGLLLKSSTDGSTKQFKITVDDSGTLTATEVTS